MVVSNTKIQFICQYDQCIFSGQLWISNMLRCAEKVVEVTVAASFSSCYGNINNRICIRYFQVMSASRPRNPWYEQQQQPPPVSSNRSAGRLPKSAENSPRRVSPSLNYTPITIATVSGDNTVFSVTNAKKSDHIDNGSSVSPMSASSNTETSRSSISTNGSYGVNFMNKFRGNRLSDLDHWPCFELLRWIHLCI